MANWQFWTLAGINILLVITVYHVADHIAHIVAMIEINTRRR